MPLAGLSPRREGAGLRDPCLPPSELRGAPSPQRSPKAKDPSPLCTSEQSKGPGAVILQDSCTCIERPLNASPRAHWGNSGSEMAPGPCPPRAHGVIRGEEGPTTGPSPLLPAPSPEVQAAEGRGGSEAAVRAAKPAGVAEAGAGRTAWRAHLLITFFTCLFTGRSRVLPGAVPCSLPYLFNKHLFDPIPTPPRLAFHTFFFFLYPLSLPDAS